VTGSGLGEVMCCAGEVTCHVVRVVGGLFVGVICRVGEVTCHVERASGRFVGAICRVGRGHSPVVLCPPHHEGERAAAHSTVAVAETSPRHAVRGGP